MMIVDPGTAIKSSHQVEKLSGSDSGSNGIGSGREVKKYIRWEESCNLFFWILLKSIEPLRRRYTDSRHPTTELPDVRGGLEPLPSVRWVDVTHFGGSIKMKILILTIATNKYIQFFTS